METLLAIIAGGFIGAALGLVGAGGAMLSVPILMYIFGFDAKPATTAALAVVLLAALSGLIPKVRKKQVLYRDAFVIWGIGSITNLGFSSIVDQIPDSVITTGFAGVLILAGASMLRPPKLDEQKRMPFSVLVVLSLLIGTMTGLFGIGGGFLGHRSQWADVQWHIPILMGASAIVIAQIASQLSHKTSPVLLRRAFAYLLFTISLFTIFKTYF